MVLRTGLMWTSIWCYCKFDAFISIHGHCKMPHKLQTNKALFPVRGSIKEAFCPTPQEFVFKCIDVVCLATSETIFHSTHPPWLFQKAYKCYLSKGAHKNVKSAFNWRREKFSQDAIRSEVNLLNYQNDNQISHVTAATLKVSKCSETGIIYYHDFPFNNINRN